MARRANLGGSVVAGVVVVVITAELALEEHGGGHCEWEGEGQESNGGFKIEERTVGGIWISGGQQRERRSNISSSLT